MLAPAYAAHRRFNDPKQKRYFAIAPTGISQLTDSLNVKSG